MSESLRRSTRRAKKRGSYAVGDIVELIRDDFPLQGRLVIKTSEDPARWLLTFEEESWKDEEVSEEAFGSVLGKADEGEGSPTGPDHPSPAASKNKNKNNKNRNKPSGGSKSGATSCGSSAEEQSATSDALQKKAVSFSQEVNPNPTDTDASASASSPKQQQQQQQQETANKKRSLRSRVSDREQRSRRRQALIVDEPEVGNNSTDEKRPRPLEPVTRVTKKSKSGVNEEVIKIPMLTGTLFLYRGLRRRAEFIRKY